MGKQSEEVPDFLKGVLWSYDLKSLDLGRDFKRIATNVLLYGDIRETNWLFSQFPKDQIIKVVKNPLKGDWDAKSLAFWSSYFGVKTDKQKEAHILFDALSIPPDS